MRRPCCTRRLHHAQAQACRRGPGSHSSSRSGELLAGARRTRSPSLSARGSFLSTRSPLMAVPAADSRDTPLIEGRQPAQQASPEHVIRSCNPALGRDSAIVRTVCAEVLEEVLVRSLRVGRQRVRGRGRHVRLPGVKQGARRGRGRRRGPPCICGSACSISGPSRLAARACACPWARGQ